jgi:hypothetical protein
MLHARGATSFAFAHAADKNADLKFPVFLREEGEHSGSLTKLLKNRHELDEAVVGAMFRSHQDAARGEYLHTADEQGVFRKYSSFAVAGRVVPCRGLFARGW